MILCKRDVFTPFYTLYLHFREYTYVLSLILCKRDVFALFHTFYLTSKISNVKNKSDVVVLSYILQKRRIYSLLYVLSYLKTPSMKMSNIKNKSDVFALSCIVQKRHIYSLLYALSYLRHRHENQQCQRRTGPRRDFESRQNRNRQDDAASQGYGGRYDRECV